MHFDEKHRFTLDRSSRKYYCPSCGKKEFVKYIDRQTENYLPDQYGRCDRENNCAYFLDPYNDGYAKMIQDQEQGFKIDPVRRKSFTQPKTIKMKKPDPVFMPKEELKQTLKGYDENVFIQNLCSRVPFPFEASDVEKVISLYRLGTVIGEYLNGATTFPYIDAKGNIRTIQVRLYDEDNHGAGGNFIHSMIKYDCDKNQEPLPDWLVSYNQNEKKVSCLFGEHLLSKYPDNPVAIAEGPKQAIYGTLYFGLPDNPKTPVWLATFNESSLNAEICRPLTKRNVTLYPDLSIGGKAYHSWCDKAKQIQKRVPGSIVQVSDLLERLATDADRKAGNDLADYLIKHDWRMYRERTKRIYKGIRTDQSPAKSLQKPPKNSTLENGEMYTFVNIPEDEKQNDGFQDNAPVAAINRTQSHQKQSMPIQACRSFEAFTNHRNELLIQNPMDPERFTVYPDIESYNNRSVKPKSRPRNEVTPDQLAPVRIDPVSLTCSIDTHS